MAATACYELKSNSKIILQSKKISLSLMAYATLSRLHPKPRAPDHHRHSLLTIIFATRLPSLKIENDPGKFAPPPDHPVITKAFESQFGSGKLLILGIEPIHFEPLGLGNGQATD
jgi:hypothetical protein